MTRKPEPSPRDAAVAGVVLAAGAGTRFGGPKGLARTPGGEPWVARAVRTLREAGCDPVLVTVGAQADAVAGLVPPGAAVVTVPDWAEGLSASLRAGLEAALRETPTAVLVVTVDTPDLPAAAVERMRALASPGALAQAVYRGEPGHPVLLGRTHLAAVAASLTGDRGARRHLAAHAALEVECGDLWSGADVDTR